MSRRQFLQRSAIAGAGALAVPAAIAQSGPQIRWRMTSSFPKTLDTLFGAGELIAKRVAAATGGRFEIRTFAPGEIVPALQVGDMATVAARLPAYAAAAQAALAWRRAVTAAAARSSVKLPAWVAVAGIAPGRCPAA